MILYVAAGSGLVALIAALAVLLVSNGSSRTSHAAEPAATLKAAGCTYRVVRATPAGIHVNDLNARPKWNTFPPSNGPHYPLPVIFNFYRDPVPLIQAVHNLEHGAVEIEWGSNVKSNEIDKIERFWNESPNGILAFLVPRLGSKIALVAWTKNPKERRGQGRLAECTSFDHKAFSAFRDAFRGKGPQYFPVDQMTPGA
jgi:hypothetical protein